VCGGGGGGGGGVGGGGGGGGGWGSLNSVVLDSEKSYVQRMKHFYLID